MNTKNNYACLKCLLDHKADFTIKNKKGETPLKLALEIDDKRSLLVCALLEAKAELCEGYAERLVMAAENGFENVVKTLLDHKMDINGIDDDGDTALDLALAHGRFNLATKLIKAGAKITVDSQAEPLLISALDAQPSWDAASKNFIHCIQALLEAKADVNVRYEFGKPALFYAKNFLAIDLLLKAKANINDISLRGGQTLLMQAPYHKYSHQDIKAILAAKADINARDYDGQTALFHASYCFYSDDILNSLIELKANPSIKDNQGRTALQFARQNNTEGGNKSKIELLEKVTPGFFSGFFSCFSASAVSSDDQKAEAKPSLKK